MIIVSGCAPLKEKDNTTIQQPIKCNSDDDCESIINDNFTAKCVNNICTKIPENAVDSVCGNGICEGNEGKYGCDPLGEGPNPCVGYIFCPEDCA